MGAFALSLLKNRISEFFNTDPEVVEKIALAMGVFSVALQVSDAIPPPNQTNRDGKNRQAKDGFGGGFPPIPPLIPPLTNPNYGDQGNPDPYPGTNLIWPNI